jgi:hypothetical protein
VSVVVIALAVSLVTVLVKGSGQRLVRLPEKLWVLWWELKQAKL